VDITPLTDRLDELISIVRFEGEGGRVLVPEHPGDAERMDLGRPIKAPATVPPIVYFVEEVIG
jgi:hypothetical protein